MSARTVDEANRTATPMELLFDLTFVAAVAQLAARLAHATVDGHAPSAVAPFLMVFFAIWWAWMSFTWFASAYDCDDVPYRLAAFVQMGGVLVLAAGTGRAFDRGDYTAVTLGYLIMRVGLLGLWIRAAVQHPEGRGASVRYAGGVAALEVLWVARLALGEHAAGATFLALVVLELLVPVWSERHGPTSWHPHHIAERYALFTIILLGESVFASTTAVVAFVEHAADPELVAVSVSSLAIVAALWWLYFAVPAGAGLEAHRQWSFVGAMVITSPLPRSLPSALVSRSRWW
ncbi:low temperature requirement protein A [Nocardioides sp. YIM 152315]|uniref:low temperature requirement protein A n=1 Tax=Nocardioides sp. YIM 152315 TaxID=3031760 RepID=UPI0023DB7174|nr:low temperature requirement protein A [Nocardioides sp. YIM 152315]MDF1605446.1 low temperature requirement protein A [Nocardioides sp. YIM 152315]